MVLNVSHVARTPLHAPPRVHSPAVRERDGAPACPVPPPTHVDAGADGGQMVLCDQLTSEIERVTWGGARQFAATLAPFGLTVPQYFALAAINRAGVCTMGALASHTHHALGTMTKLIDHLVRRGLVERRSDATNRRIVLVALTPDSKSVLAHVEEIRRRRLDAVVAAMGEPAVRGLIHLLSAYLAAMEIEASEASTERCSPESDCREGGDPRPHARQGRTPQ